MGRKEKQMLMIEANFNQFVSPGGSLSRFLDVSDEMRAGSSNRIDRYSWFVV